LNGGGAFYGNSITGSLGADVADQCRDTVGRGGSVVGGLGSLFRGIDHLVDAQEKLRERKE